ncbi:hypothetical protein [Streptomyces sp. UNOB3_S3]|uniref:hypothetical protein n=1 Tax=Streptomyces sp. UNOB3_S3 TaxID=2871682 RepID=UPI001E63487B|nr:hypothetical protein [Streptomyces sp. UNOB3_S3]MCC3775073.1 hypothetical protein [Streptomyces sp. UNOB3_S3]
MTSTSMLYFASGMPLGEIYICDDLGKTPGEGAAAWVKAGGKFSVPYEHCIAMCVAGERAQDRWMREQGLWTPERAWVIERLSAHDRNLVAECLKECRRAELGFGYTPAGGLDFAVVHRAADAARYAARSGQGLLGETAQSVGHL